MDKYLPVDTFHTPVSRASIMLLEPAVLHRDAPSQMHEALTASPEIVPTEPAHGIPSHDPFHGTSDMGINTSFQISTPNAPDVFGKWEIADYDQRHQSYLEQHVTGTCEWILDSDDFRRWRDCAEIGVGMDREDEAEKDREFSEVWESSQTLDPVTGKWNGLRLTGNANKSQDHTSGLYGRTRFAIVILRQSAVPWIARFQIRTKAGFAQEAKTSLRRWVGVDPATTILKLSGEDGCVYTADSLSEKPETKVDVNSMRSLADSPKKLAELVGISDA